jgi:hypothetical protein
LSELEAVKSKMARQPRAKHKPKGRPRGAKKWHDDDLNKMLTYLEANPPLERKVWDDVSLEVTDFAQKERRPKRSATACECIFKRLTAGPPTGAGALSEPQKRARAISERVDLLNAQKVLNDRRRGFGQDNSYSDDDDDTD